MNQEGETQPLITNTEKGAVGMFKKRLLSNGSLSEAVVTAMDEKEAERVLNALEAGSEKARAEEVSRLNAEFITNYPESEAGKLAIENAAKELAVKNADKEDRDNQWKEVEGKVAMTREEFDATPKVGRDVIVNSVKEVEPALKGEKIDNEAPKDTDPDKPEGDA